MFYKAGFVLLLESHWWVGREGLPQFHGTGRRTASVTLLVRDWAFVTDSVLVMLAFEGL